MLLHWLHTYLKSMYSEWMEKVNLGKAVEASFTFLSAHTCLQMLIVGLSGLESYKTLPPSAPTLIREMWGKRGILTLSDNLTDSLTSVSFEAY